MMQPAHALSSACGARTQHTLLLPRGAYWQQPRLQRPVRPRRTAAASNAAATATPAPTPPAPAPSSSSNAAAAHTWRWRGSRAVFYERTGRGPIPVVLVHGMGACHEHWRRLVDVLDVDALYTVYALDLVGGATPLRRIAAQRRDALIMCCMRASCEHACCLALSACRVTPGALARTRAHRRLWRQRAAGARARPAARPHGVLLRRLGSSADRLC